MRRYLFALVVAALISVQLPLITVLSEEKSPSLDDLKQKRQEAYRQLQGARAVEQGQRDKLLAVRMRLAASERRVSELAGEMDRVRGRLEETRARRDGLRQKLDERRRHLDAWLRLMYEDGSVSYLEVLLAATDFIDFVERLELVFQVIDANVALLREVKSLHDRVAAEERELAAEEARLRDLRQREAAAAAELRQLESARQKALAEAMATAGEHAAAMVALDRMWAEALPALERFLAGFPYLPWGLIEPESIDMDHEQRTVDVIANEKAINRVFPLLDPILGQVRLRLRPGEVALADVAGGLFELRGRLEPAEGNRVRYVPVALDFLGVSVGPEVLDQLVRDHNLSFEYSGSGLPLRLKAVEVEEGRLRLRFTW